MSQLFPFLGGSPPQPQIGIITASGRSCRIIDDHGATIDMNPGETHTCEIEYGRLRVFRVQS